MTGMFWAMIKEEWRSHSTMFGSLMFSLFPFLILFLSFSFCLSYPLVVNLLSFENTFLLLGYFFVLFGIIVGVFGLHGKEFMNRRFRQVSLIAYSSRSLPVSDLNIFLNFFFKDLLYYFVLWILPIITGFFFADFFINTGVNFIILSISVLLSFLIGLSTSFVLSSIYSYSSKLLIFLSALIGLFLLITGFNSTLLYFLPSYLFFMNPSILNLIFCLTFILFFSSLGALLLRVDYSSKNRFFSNWYSGLEIFFKNSFVSKDLLDLHRSEGGLGKILLSFVFPLTIIWIVLFFFLNIIPVGNFFLLFSVLLGIISSSMYNWITEFDVFSSYEFLPVKVSRVLKSKIITYSLLNIVSVIVLIISCFESNNLSFLFHGLFSFIVSSYYTLGVTLFLTGFYPNILLYNPRILLTYLFASLPIPSILIIISLVNFHLLLLSPILLIIPFLLFKLSFKKWDSWNHPRF